MIEKSYSTGQLSFYGYSKHAQTEIKSILEGDDFLFSQGQFGGGPGEALQIIAHLNIRTDNPFWTLGIGLTTNLIYDIIKKLRSWFKSNGLSEQDKPTVFIYIYENKKPISNVKLYLDLDYSKGAIQNLIEDGKNETAGR